MTLVLYARAFGEEVRATPIEYNYIDGSFTCFPKGASNSPIYCVIPTLALLFLIIIRDDFIGWIPKFLAKLNLLKSDLPNTEWSWRTKD